MEVVDSVIGKSVEQMMGKSTTAEQFDWVPAGGGDINWGDTGTGNDLCMVSRALHTAKYL
jgi:hypothetical protein